MGEATRRESSFIAQIGLTRLTEDNRYEWRALRKVELNLKNWTWAQIRRPNLGMIDKAGLIAT